MVILLWFWRVGNCGGSTLGGLYQLSCPAQLPEISQPAPLLSWLPSIRRYLWLVGFVVLGPWCSLRSSVLRTTPLTCIARGVGFKKVFQEQRFSVLYPFFTSKPSRLSMYLPSPQTQS